MRKPDHIRACPARDASCTQRRLLTAVAVPLLLSAAVGTACATEGDEAYSHRPGRSYSLGLWGDLPYSTEQAVGVANMIEDMNAQRLAFTVHDGDLKAGGGTCADEVYYAALDFFNSLEAPAMFTPGDNDWTDCDRESAGGYNSLERLNFERELFFSTPFSLGQHRMHQDVQATPYVENRRWSVGGVVYATLNIQGSCNNLCDVAPDPDEYAGRNTANIEWMQETFAEAEKRHAAAVMFISQADVGWDESDPTRAPLRDPKTLAETDSDLDGFQVFLLALRDEVIAFRKPVAYVHGDSHYFRIDKPFLDAEGKRLENFTRVETFGDHQANGTNDVNWLKVLVDPRSREVFSYEPQIVPANRVAVPAP
jgi:hypothetical protein